MAPLKNIPQYGTEFGIWRVSGLTLPDKYGRTRVKLACLKCSTSRDALVSDLYHGKYAQKCLKCKTVDPAAR